MKVTQDNINASEIIKIIVSIDKINSEMGQVRDRLTAVETNVKWIKWFVIFNFTALIGLIINSFYRML